VSTGRKRSRIYSKFEFKEVNERYRKKAGNLSMRQLARLSGVRASIICKMEYQDPLYFGGGDAFPGRLVKIMKVYVRKRGITSPDDIVNYLAIPRRRLTDEKYEYIKQEIEKELRNFEAECALSNAMTEALPAEEMASYVEPLYADRPNSNLQMIREDVEWLSRENKALLQEEETHSQKGAALQKRRKEWERRLEQMERELRRLE
jgi:predicted ribosome quality control (RQC) complex YloA/Tae2 family protein